MSRNGIRGGKWWYLQEQRKCGILIIDSVRISIASKKMRMSSGTTGLITPTLKLYQQGLAASRPERTNVS